MNGSGEVHVKLAEPVARRSVLLRALGLVGAAAALSGCRHLMGGAGVGAYPVDRGDGDDRDGMGGGDGQSGDGQGGGYGGGGGM